MSGAWPSGDTYGNIWGMEWKTACFNAWDPEKPRTYTNFNPFERNDESAMADTNGCFPGQSRGYISPNRPDQSWEIMQAERAAMDALKKDPKFSVTGKPGNFTRKWQDNLGPPSLAALAVTGKEAPVQSRARTPQMSGAWPSGDTYGNIWGMEWKTACFNAWDPEKPRTYTNFNPFERNDESAMADTNGCFPGQSRGYISPNRPDQSWEIMQAERAAMDALKKDPKFSVTGKPGNFTRKWQDNLGPP